LGEAVGEPGSGTDVGAGSGAAGGVPGADGGASAGVGEGGAVPREPLPDVVTRLSAAGVFARLDNAARRGRLPGFATGPGEDHCRVAAFGTPFDKEVVVRATEDASGQTRLDFHTTLHWKMPVLLAVVLAFVVEPGRLLTHSMLVTYFETYNGWVQNVPWFGTMLWYYALTIPFLPYVWVKARNQTDRTTWAAAHEAVGKIAREVSGEIVPPRLRRSVPRGVRGAGVAR